MVLRSNDPYQSVEYFTRNSGRPPNATELKIINLHIQLQRDPTAAELFQVVGGASYQTLSGGTIKYSFTPPPSSGQATTQLYYNPTIGLQPTSLSGLKQLQASVGGAKTLRDIANQFKSNPVKPIPFIIPSMNQTDVKGIIDNAKTDSRTNSFQIPDIVKGNIPIFLVAGIGIILLLALK